MTRRIFVDTEWTAPPWSESMELMWVGLADEEGHTWYGISAEADLDAENNDFIAGLLRLISPDESRLTRADMATAILEFCGDVDEFWAWVPSVEGLRDWFGLGDAEAAEIFDGYWDTDLQMLRSVVQPWPDEWPDRLLNLNRAAVEAGIELPTRAENHLHPRTHVEWNAELFERIRAAGFATS